VVLAFVILSLISQGALAESVAALDRGESRRFSSAVRAGLSNFWRVLGYYVLFILIVLLVLGLLIAIVVSLVLLMAGVFAGTEAMGARVLAAVLAGLVGVVLLIVGIVMLIALSIVWQFALRGIVVGRERVFASVGSGYRLFRDNLGRSLLVWLIQIAVSIGAGIALLIALLLVALVLALPAIFLAIAHYITAAIVAGVAAFLIWLMPAVVATGAFGAFGHSYWTLAYLWLVSPPAEPLQQPGEQI
jgi:hypothetical protein